MQKLQSLNADSKRRRSPRFEWSVISTHARDWVTDSSHQSEDEDKESWLR